ncbi:MAG: F0F1 ATP synthase subunit delta, partial [Betaproteobacteria bacterium]
AGKNFSGRSEALLTLLRGGALGTDAFFIGPYAEAAFKIACQAEKLSAWSDLLANLNAVVNDTRVLSCIRDPNVQGQDLQNFVLSVLGDTLENDLRRFVEVLIQNHRLELMPHIRVQFENLRRQHEGELEVKIISALPISAEQIQLLVAQLETKYRHKVTVQVETDSTLIGGVKIVVGDKVIDATVRGKLDALATALTH